MCSLSYRGRSKAFFLTILCLELVLASYYESYQGKYIRLLCLDATWMAVVWD